MSETFKLIPGTWVKKVGGDYEAIAQIVGEPMVLDTGVVRYNIAIREITKGRLIHVANPKALEPCDPPAKTIKPLQAWAVVGKDGSFCLSALDDEKEILKLIVDRFNGAFPSRAPHRVVRVEVREIKE